MTILLLNKRSINNMPRSKQQFEQMREASAERIIQAATRVFAERGYANASVRLIAGEAGISLGLIYNYFASKEELLKAIYLRGMQDVEASFAEADAEQKRAPEEKLRALIESSFRHLKNNREFWRLSYGVRMQPAVLAALADEVRASIEAIFRKLEKLLEQANHNNANVEAAILFALIDGIAQHYVLDPENYPLEEVTARVVAEFCSSDKREKVI